MVDQRREYLESYMKVFSEDTSPCSSLFLPDWSLYYPQHSPLKIPVCSSLKARDHVNTVTRTLLKNKWHVICPPVTENPFLAGISVWAAQLIPAWGRQTARRRRGRPLSGYRCTERWRQVEYSGGSPCISFNTVHTCPGLQHKLTFTRFKSISKAV